MTSRKLVLLVAAAIFLLIAGLNLYRLLVGFPITIAGYTVGATASFFAMCIAAALSLMLYREAGR
jgi:hypothetical protein